MSESIAAFDAAAGKILKYPPAGGKRNEKALKPPPRKLRILALLCCAGGAAIGYSQAGFEVVGVDIKPQPNYPLSFIQTDALALDPEFIASFDAIHASPPCQSYSDLAKRNGNADEWPRLIEPVRDMLVRSGLPYVIENVEGLLCLIRLSCAARCFPVCACFVIGCSRRILK